MQEAKGSTYTLSGVASYVTRDDSTPRLIDINASFAKREHLTTYMKELKATGYTFVDSPGITVFNPATI